MDRKKIYAKRVAYELIRRGHFLIDMENNFKYPHLKVFIFKETDRLLEDLSNITEMGKVR